MSLAVGLIHLIGPMIGLMTAEWPCVPRGLEAQELKLCPDRQSCSRCRNPLMNGDPGGRHIYQDQGHLQLS